MNKTLRSLLIRVAETARAHSVACMDPDESVWMATASATNEADGALVAYAKNDTEARRIPEIDEWILALAREEDARAARWRAQAAVEALGERLASEGSATTEPASAQCGEREMCDGTGRAHAPGVGE